MSTEYVRRGLCLLGLHDWKRKVITTSAYPLERGYVEHRCARCGRAKPTD